MTNRRLFAAAAALLGVALIVLGARYARRMNGGGSDEPITVELLANPTPVAPISMKTIDGKTITADAWRGKVVIVNFWATWCPPCRAEIPDLVALQQKYHDQVQVIGISEDDDPPEAVQKFADEYHINYPIVMKTPEIEKAFPGVYALPTSFVIDREFKLQQRHVGMLNAARTEAETRVLAGLTTDAKIARVEDSTKKLIKDAAQATKIPGVDLQSLPPAKRAVALQKLNAENCTCGCGLPVAACRINDPTCSISLPIAQKIVAEVAGVKN
jgi:thiol-disulfide isomerase/thioredoxin